MSYQQLEMMFSPSSDSPKHLSNKDDKIKEENEELKKKIEILETKIKILETKVDVLLDIIKINK